MMAGLRTGRRGRAGVTLIEMMLVSAVMAVLALLVTPTVRLVHRRGQERQLKRGLEVIRAAIDEYHSDWENGYIESDSEHGWPESLEELTEEIDYTGPPEDALDAGAEGGAAQPGALPPGLAQAQQQWETVPKVYLKRLPKDPFNVHEDEWDSAGWRCLSYEDEPDETSWSGEGIYDVRSASEWRAIDGSRYAEW